MTCEGSFEIAKDADPEWEVDAIVWIEQKSPHLMRPDIRRRMRVLAKEVGPESVTYTLRGVEPKLTEPPPAY